MWNGIGTANSLKNVRAPLRQGMTARCSRANAKHDRTAANRVASSCGLANTLRRLEFNMACHQSWLARSAAHFIRRTSVLDCDRSSPGRLGGPRVVAADAPL